MYIVELIKEIRQWLIVKKTAKKNLEFLESNSIRVDWIGRMYTVINLPEEIANNSNELVKESYVLSQLRKYDQILLKLELSDIVYPEFSRIENADAYLLILSAKNDALNVVSLLKRVVLYGAFALIGKLIYTFVNVNYGNPFTIAYDFLSRYF